MISFHLACALAAVTALVPAQSVLVVPDGRAQSEGNSLDVKPFGYRQIRHEHYIGRSQLLALGSAATIRQLSYRRDGLVPGTFTRGGDGALSVRMANVTVNPLDPGSTFMPAAQLTTVFLPRVIGLPTLPPPGAGQLAPFNITFVLDAPFAYTGGHLVISHYCYSTSAAGPIVQGGYLIDAETAEQPGWGSVTTFGAGCPAGRSRATGIAPNPGAGNLALFLHDGQPGAIALASLGTSNQQWNGIPLPLPLAGLGLPGCSLSIDLVWQTAVLVQGSGLAELFLPVPGDATLAGNRLFAQFLSLQDPRVNPMFPITTSEALDITLGSQINARVPDMSVVLGTMTQANAAGGLLYPGEGPVVQIGY